MRAAAKWVASRCADDSAPAKNEEITETGQWIWGVFGVRVGVRVRVRVRVRV